MWFGAKVTKIILKLLSQLYYNLTRHCSKASLFNSNQNPVSAWIYRLLKVLVVHSIYCNNPKYRIQPNYRTVRLGFSKLLGTLSGGKICIYLLRIHYKKDQKRTYLMIIIQFFLTSFIKAYVMGARLNCIDKSMQFK